ncbi:alpha-galactosidase [Oerskovia turbata]
MTTTAPVVHLRGGGTSVVVTTSGGRLPRVLHWGPDLGDLTDDDLAAMETTASPAIGDSAVTYPQPVPVVAQLSEGWLGRPGIVGDRAGAHWAPRFEIDDVVVERATDAERVRVTSSDAAYALSLGVEIELLASGLVRVRAEVGNTGDSPYEVRSLDLGLPVPATAGELCDLTGRWALERVPQRRPFDVGSWVRESRGGKPGLEHAFMMLAGEPGFANRSGRVWGVHLGWSGNHALVAERTPAGVRRLSGGELPWPGELVLGPGETSTTPWLYGSWGEGLDDLSHRVHRWLRSRPAHPRTPRPVVVNTWEAVYFQHDLATLERLAEAGAAIGAERFVLDDGWFTGRRDDTTSLGDWTVDATVWPDGIDALADRVRELGMDFGIWFEPEMVNLDSDLAREHPEWVFDAGHGPGMPSRHQHVLDLAHPGAYRHVRDAMIEVVERLDVAYVKWDHNRYLLDAGHSPSGRAGVRAQTLAAYALMAELKELRPGLEIESCASGGGRVDLGVLQLTDRVWPSDCNDPHDRLEIQRWTSLLVPPELQGTHVGARDSHTTHRVHPLDFRAQVAMWGHLGVEVNLLEASEDELDEIRAWVGLHRSFRALLHSGDVVHADASDPALRLEGVVSADQEEALFQLSVVDRPATWPPGRVTLPGLAPERRYRVRVVDPVGRGATGVLPPWNAIAEGVVLPGTVLSEVGIEAPSLDPDRAVLWHVAAV